MPKTREELTSQEVEIIRDKLIDLGFSVNIRSWRTVEPFEGQRTYPLKRTGIVRHAIYITDCPVRLKEVFKVQEIAESFGVEAWIYNYDEQGTIKLEIGFTE